MNIFKPSSSAYLLHSLDEVDGMNIFFASAKHITTSKRLVSLVSSTAQEIYTYISL